MKSFFSNLNQWLRKIHRWMVIPVALILIANILLLGTPNGRIIQRIQQTTVLFMFVTGLYLYCTGSGPSYSASNETPIKMLNQYKNLAVY